MASVSIWCFKKRLYRLIFNSAKLDVLTNNRIKTVRPHIELNPIKIITQRLVQRDINKRDIESVSTILNREEVQQYTLSNNPAFIRQQILDAIKLVNDLPRYCYSFVVLLNSTDKVIGQLDINIIEDNPDLDIESNSNFHLLDNKKIFQPHVKTNKLLKTAQIGWDFAPEYWNLGYATEAAKGAITFAFLYLGVNAILADCFFNNKASRRVMDKIGMEQQNLTLWQQGQLQEQYKEARSIVSYRLSKLSWEVNCSGI